MSTTYTGIDYGRGVSNRDPETGIRYGVIAQGSISPEAFDDVWQNARDLSYEHAVDEFKARLNAVECEDDLVPIVGDLLRPMKYVTDRDYAASQWKHVEDMAPQDRGEELWIVLEDRFNDAMSYCDCGDRDWLYEADGYKLTNCLSTDVFVLASPFYTYAQFCSPCVPGACNLDSPLACDTIYIDKKAFADSRCYALGHDYFENGRAPYPVYSVATGELVAPAE